MTIGTIKTDVGEEVGTTIEEASETVGFGDDLIEADDVVEGQQSQQPGTGEEEGEFNPEGVDWATIRPDDVPEGFHHLITTARNIQSASHRNLNDATRQAENDRAADRARIAQLETQIQTLGRSGTSEPTPPGGIDQDFMYQTLQSMGVTEATDFSNGIAYMQLAEKVMNKMLEGRGFASASDLTELNTKVTASSTQTQQSTDQRDRASLQTELNTVYAEYGEANVAPLLNEIGGLMRTNQRNGQPHTIKSAYIRLTGNGKPSKEQVRLIKKKAGPSVPTARGTGAIPEKGELTDPQALSAMQKLLDAE
jgi:hypothetical protein